MPLSSHLARGAPSEERNALGSRQPGVGDVDIDGETHDEVADVIRQLRDQTVGATIRENLRTYRCEYCKTSGWTSKTKTKVSS